MYYKPGIQYHTNCVGFALLSFMSNANAQTVSMDPNGGDAEMALEDGSLGHHEMPLTPREYEDPLSLPGGEHHISFAKFLEVKLLFSLKCVLRFFFRVFSSMGTVHKCVE